MAWAGRTFIWQKDCDYYLETTVYFDCHSFIITTINSLKSNRPGKNRPVAFILNRPKVSPAFIGANGLTYCSPDIIPYVFGLYVIPKKLLTLP